MSDGKKYAEVAWTANDVQDLRPDWTDERCEEWLANNGGGIQDAMVERGWIAMETLLDMTDVHHDNNPDKVSG